MPFELPSLPWPTDALEPHLSAETLDYHYGKHHKTYVTNLNKLTAGKPEAQKSLEDLIRTADGGLFNNAAQVWNHTFYWNCMKPDGGGAPAGKPGDAIKAAFGSFDTFREAFTEAATAQFGSGWAWLVRGGDGKLKVTRTGNADCPLRYGDTPVLTIDIWEHAYYIDYRNARPKYIETFLDHLVNWDFVAKNLAE